MHPCTHDGGGVGKGWGREGGGLGAGHTTRAAGYYCRAGLDSGTHRINIERGVNYSLHRHRSRVGYADACSTVVCAPL